MKHPHIHPHLHTSSHQLGHVASAGVDPAVHDGAPSFPPPPMCEHTLLCGGLVVGVGWEQRGRWWQRRSAWPHPQGGLQLASRTAGAGAGAGGAAGAATGATAVVVGAATACPVNPSSSSLAATSATRRSVSSSLARPTPPTHTHTPTPAPRSTHPIHTAHTWPRCTYAHTKHQHGMAGQINEWTAVLTMCT